MKRLCPVIFVVFLLPFFSCKKYIRQQEENAVLSIMTNGLWYVSGFQQNDSNITASFSGYLFKFDANNIVTGTKANVPVQGVWSADINNLTITTNFPNAGDPLKELNETWKITDSYTDSVSAKVTDTINHTSNILQLHKQ
ncbi:MAG TPA: hypothetical protein VGM30_06705 [Puia sp.]|jgi:hypothetical protein